MSGKYALIIGNTDYNDSGLAQLMAPGKDAEDFARVLTDQNICGFDDVKVLHNEPSASIIEAIDEFFDQKKPDDLLVLYFSGHGVRDEFGSLYLAVKNTIRTRLRSTAIKSDYIREAMEQSRSKRQVLILDCCNSGAFPQGTKAEVGGVMGLTQAFQGYGRFILTASDATQFAWEGNKVIGETDNSLFTHFLVKGLEGEADNDSDGRITVDELYDYTYEQISKVTPKQTPTKSSSKVEGEIILRQITRLQDIKPVSLPDHLISEIENPYPEIRLRAVEQLAKLLTSKNLGLARSAREELERLEKEDDSRRVMVAATKILEPIRQAEKIEQEKASERAEPFLERKTDGKRPALEQSTSSTGKRTTLQPSPQPILKWILVGIIGLIVVATAIWGVPYLANMSPPVATKTASPTEPAATSPSTLEPTSLPTPTYAPVLSGTSIPLPEQQITTENAAQVLQLARWGKGRISNMVYSPKGDSIAIASSLGIYICNSADLKQILFIEMGTAVNSVVFSPDGKTLASGSNDNLVRLWQVSDGSLLQTLQGHTSSVLAVAFSPNGQTLASGSSDNTIRVWQVSDGTLLQTLQGHTSVVRSVAFSHEGLTIVSGSGDSTIRLWRVNNGSLIHTFEGHTASVTSVAFSPNGQMLASAGEDKTIRLWSVADQTLLQTLEVAAAARSVAFSPDGQTVASGSGRVVRLWKVSDGTPLQKLEGHRGAVRSVVFSPDGKTLASSGDSDAIRVWQVSDGALIETFDWPSSFVYSISVSPDGEMVAAACGDNAIRLWRTSDGTLLRTIQAHDEFIGAVAFSPDGKTLASASADKTIRLWQVSDGTLLQTLPTQADAVYAVAFSPDGKILAFAGEEKAIRLWQVSDGTLLRTLDGHTQWIEEVTFSPDGQLLASASGDQTIRLWRVSDGVLLQTLTGHTDWNSSVAFSPDGQTLASGSADTTIRLWQISDGTLLQTLQGHTNWVTGVAFSPDGQLLVSSSADGTVGLWRVSDGTLLQKLEGHTNAIEAVSFSANGQILFSGSDDGTIRLWGIKP